MFGQYREGHPSPWDKEIEEERAGHGNQEGPVASRVWGKPGNLGSKVCFDMLNGSSFETNSHQSTFSLLCCSYLWIVSVSLQTFWAEWCVDGVSDSFIVTLKDPRVGCFDYFKISLKVQILGQSPTITTTIYKWLIQLLFCTPHGCALSSVTVFFSISSKFTQFSSEMEALQTFQLGNGIGNKV